MTRLPTALMGLMLALTSMIGTVLTDAAAETPAPAASALPERPLIVETIDQSLAVAELWHAFMQLEIDFVQAAEWLYDAAATGEGEGEAAMAVRRSLQRVRTDLPLLRDRLRAMPDSAPSVQPVLVWDDKWKRLLRARMDWLAVDSEGMALALEALNADDFAEVDRLYAQAAERFLAFNELEFAEYQRSRHLFQKESLDLALWDFGWASQPYNEANAHRSSAQTPEEWDQRTPPVLEAMATTLKDQSAAFARFEARLDPFRPHLVTLLQVLTGDNSRASTLADEIMESYAEAGAVMAEEIEIYRKFARLEQRLWDDAMQPEVYAEFALLSARLSELRKARSAGDVARLRLLHAASRPAD